MLLPSPSRLNSLWKALSVAVATAYCSGVVVQTAERYWGPMSLPWRLSWVESWFSQKARSSASPPRPATTGL